MDDKLEKDWSNTFASNYVQLCSTLAGFCLTIIIFLMSPGLFPEIESEVSIVLLLIASSGYLYAASWSAFAPSRSIKTRNKKIWFVNTIFLYSSFLFLLSWDFSSESRVKVS